MTLQKVAFTKAFTVNGDTLVVPVGACQFAGLQIEGTWTGTLSIEASVGGVTYAAFGMRNSVDGVVTASYTVLAQAYSNDIGAFQSLRIRATAAMTGTANVTVLAS